MTVNTPNCRACNDSGLIPAEHGNQPCPRCDAFERKCAFDIIRGAAPHPPAKSRAHVSLPHSAAVADICDRSEYLPPAYHGEEEDEEPPSDWGAVAIYLVIAAIAVIAVGVAYGVGG